jgi:putative hydrolase of the HAD superfamily
MPTLDLIALDADDTLWHNEAHYQMTQERFRQLLAPYCRAEIAEGALYATEMRNLKLYGYGAKSFALSMIETAIELTDGKIGGGEIQRIIDAVKEMLNNGISLLPGVEETLATLARRYPLMLITKGDLFDQESKLARSGLGGHFDHVEIVSKKTSDVYAGLLKKMNVEPARFLMVGNSVRSDILPVIEIGGHAVHIPYHVTWAHEAAPPPMDAPYVHLDSIRRLPAWLQQQM